jgi:hypothetical protein
MVKEEIKKLGLTAINLELGELEIEGEISTEKYEQIRLALLKNGHELMEDKKAIQIEKIKNAIIEMIHFSDEPLEQNYSDFLANKLEFDYT